MYTSFHSAAGIMIGLACPGPLGLIAATASHFPIDALKETPCYGGSITRFFVVDALIFNGLMALGCFLLRPDQAPFLIACMVAANGADIVDKIRSKALKLDEILWCHQSWWPTWWALDAGTTFCANAVSVILVLLAMGTR